jgi:hypothetical protein
MPDISTTLQHVTALEEENSFRQHSLKRNAFKKASCFIRALKGMYERAFRKEVSSLIISLKMWQSDKNRNMPKLYPRCSRDQVKFGEAYYLSYYLPLPVIMPSLVARAVMKVISSTPSATDSSALPTFILILSLLFKV